MRITCEHPQADLMEVRPGILVSASVLVFMIQPDKLASYVAVWGTTYVILLEYRYWSREEGMTQNKRDK